MTKNGSIVINVDPTASSGVANSTRVVTSAAPPPEPTTTTTTTSPEPTPGGTTKPAGHATRGAKSAQTAGTAAAAPTHAPAREPTRDQRRRMEALQRLCDQGTFTAAECSQKRAAILREGG